MVDNSPLKSEKPFVSPYLRLKPRTFEEARRDRETETSDRPDSVPEPSRAEPLT